MSALDWADELEPRPSAVTVGKFDGVHVGHRRIIEQLRSIADAKGLETVVVTFDRNPLEVVRPDRAPLPLTTNEHRVELLREAGVDRVVVIPFTKEVAAVPAEEFAQRRMPLGAVDDDEVVVGDAEFGGRGLRSGEQRRDGDEPVGVGVAQRADEFVPLGAGLPEGQSARPDVVHEDLDAVQPASFHGLGGAGQIA